MNVGSVRNKLDKVKCLVRESKCDIPVLTETEIEIGLYELDEYNAVHLCREKRGGGVSIYVRKLMEYREVESSEHGDLFNWLCVHIGDENFKVTVIYRHPSYRHTQLRNNLDYIMGRYRIVGDLNIILLEENTTEVVYYKTQYSV
ncbi:hypothetical protein HHI36_011811 [Cryptolaemus montrouzieri]|uniref:Uncharacterized protein n=1 Tax=Cryptolaemus montrouzieri TaxID=559131 RepID=A0ABD2NCF8_9CUCU